MSDRGAARSTGSAHELDQRVVVQAAAAAPDAIIVVDAAGVVRYWNGGAERIFGYEGREMVGATLDRIIPERLRDRHHSGFKDAMDRGATRYGESDLLAVPAVKADGTTISVEFSVTLLRDGGRVSYVAAIMRDVTARWTREREMRRRLEAVEAQQAGSDKGSLDATGSK